MLGSVKKFLVWGTAAFLIALIISCSPQQNSNSSLRTISTPSKPPAPQIAQNPSSTIHLTLGNPSRATTSVSNADNFLIEKPQYALSYNRRNGTPNWVSWQLNRSWLGQTPRQNNFRPDDLPSGWYAVRPSDYSNTGYDKGHMAPSADRTKTVKDNAATFLMSNIIPQTPDNNQGPWADLEEYSRELVTQKGKELYIISGPEGKKEAIASGKVTVPTKTWKIIVVLDRPGSGVRGVTTNTRVIAVEMPNSQGIRNTNWQTYRTTVQKIEAVTGYNFLSNVPASVQKIIETRADSQN